MWKHPIPLLPLFLLLLLHFKVECCLIVGSSLIEMNGCKCPQIRLIDQAGIQNLQYGSYLSGRTILDPASVTVTDECNVTVDAGVNKNFFFMIFRSDAPPIFNSRFFPDSTPSPFHPIGLECTQIDGGSFEWTYYDGVVKNMSFALQSNDQLCSCGSFPSASQVDPAVCDVFQVSCPNVTNQVYWFSLNMAYNLMLPRPSEELVDDATCVSGTWYYNGMALENVQLLCSDAVSVYNLRPTTYTYHCGCREIVAISADNGYMNVYDMNGDYSDFSIDTPSVSYSDCSSTPVISCPDSDYVVFFGRNFGPMQYTPDKLPPVTCHTTPLAPFSPTSGTFWFVDGVMLSEAAFVCLTKKQTLPPMGACQCPQIQYIDEAGIQKLPYSEYLANRPTASPTNVTVTDDCSVTVTTSGITYSKSFFMIFRSGAPPIFSRRIPQGVSGPFNPPGLKCALSNGVYHWQYFGGNVYNMSFAFQSGESFTCSAFPGRIGTIYNSNYDIFDIECANETFAQYWKSPYLEYPLVLPELGSETILDAMCVDGTWYYNNIKIGEVEPYCSSPISVLNNETTTYTFTCGCMDMQIITADNEFLKVYDLDGTFSNSILETPTISYPADCTTPVVTCPNSHDQIVFFGRNFGPMKYTAGNLPPMVCQQNPLILWSTYPASVWIVDGVMLSEPAVACVSTQSAPIEMNGCKCPQIRLIDQAGIQNLQYGSYLSGRTVLDPASVTVTDECNVTVDAGVNKNFFFMIFRSDAPPIFNRRFFPDSTPSPFHPIGLECTQIDGGSFEWTYYDGVVRNMSFALQSNDQLCSCGSFPSASQVDPAVCDVFQVSCPNVTNQVYWFSLNMAYNLMLPRPSEELVDDATCVSGTWYYNGMALENVQLLCSDAVSVYNLRPTTYTYHCGCREIVAISADNGYMNVYDMNGDYSDFSIDTPSVSYSDCSSSPVISCPDSDYVVFFGRNFGPMQYTPDKLPPVTCHATPLAVDPRSSGAFWFVDGVMLSEAAFVCLTAPPPPIEMNGCPCPQIQYINQASILKLKYGSYLANRTTFYPTSVTVSETCDVTVDAASSCFNDNYYLMLFRSDAPPIFNRRFLPDVTRAPFNVSGLECSASKQWTYNGGVLNDVFIALQSDGEMCMCGNFPGSTQPIPGVCDIVDVKCPDPTNLAYITTANLDYDLVLPSPSENLVESIECVARDWYYNGIPLTNPRINCKDPVNLVDGSNSVFSSICGCPAIEKITTDNKLSQVYISPYASRFPNYTPQSGLLTYSSTCQPSLVCGGANKPMLFSRNFEPIVYSGQGLSCELPPSAVNSTLSTRFWYIDGVMLSEPAFGCVAVYENI